MRASGSAARDQSPAPRAQLADTNAAHFKRRSRTQILNFKHPNKRLLRRSRTVHRSSRRFSAPPTLPAENMPGLAFVPVWAGRPTTASTLVLGVLSLWVVPFSKHELAGHQDVGESPPRAAVRCSKLNSFLLAKQECPRPTPFPVKYWLARLWASNSLSSFDTVRQRGMSHKISALRSAPYAVLAPFSCLGPPGPGEGPDHGGSRGGT